jgi:hypothetical protein
MAVGSGSYKIPSQSNDREKLVRPAGPSPPSGGMGQ